MKFFRSTGLIIAATCCFGVAQGAAKDWTNLFDGLKQPDFKVNEPYKYHDWLNQLTDSSSSTQAELGAAGADKLKEFFNIIFDKLKYTARTDTTSSDWFPPKIMRTDLTVQQAENLLKIFNDAKIKNHIIGPEDPEMPNITNPQNNEEYETHLFLASLIAAFGKEITALGAPTNKQQNVSKELLATIWADADTPSVWKIFFDALKEANFDTKIWEQKFSEASKSTLQELFYSLFMKIKTQNISSQQIKNFAACLKKDSAIEKSIITNMNGAITLRYQNTPTKIEIVNDPAHIIPLIQTTLDKNKDPKTLWSDLIAKHLKSISKEYKDLKKKLDESAMQAIKTNHDKAQDAYNSATKTSSTSTENQLNQALIALKEKLTHLAYELNRLQNPGMPAFTQPEKSALKAALDAAKAEYDKTYGPLDERKNTLEMQKSQLTILSVKIALETK